MTIEDAPVSDVSEQRPLLDQPVSESIANTNASESTTGETVPASVGASKKRVNGGDEVSGADRDSTKKLKAGGSDDEAKESRRPKRKVACLIGYCGTGYHGLQVNPGLKTIEGTLFEAFVKAGAVSQANADDPKKVEASLKEKRIPPDRSRSPLGAQHVLIREFTQQSMSSA